MTDKNDLHNPEDTGYIARRRRVSTIVGAGMLLVVAGLLLPLCYLFDTDIISYFKWVFAAGALLCLGGRCVNVSAPGESVRLRRLYRLEFWSSVCFAIAAFFWFWNENKFNGLPVETGSLAILRDTILFSMAGALIQVITSWLIYFQQKKERQ